MGATDGVGSQKILKEELTNANFGLFIAYTENKKKSMKNIFSKGNKEYAALLENVMITLKYMIGKLSSDLSNYFFEYNSIITNRMMSKK